MGTSRRSANRPASEERAAALLTGSGPSQLGVDASMRGRDVSRPRPEHMAQAEEIVQVSYRPRTHPRPPLPSTGQPGKGGSDGSRDKPRRGETPDDGGSPGVSTEET